jgi:mycofactocin precursor peptide peptidase
MHNRLELSTRTKDEVSPNTTLLIPLGSTEQHGPHLPLGTDTIIATAIAEGAAALHADVVVAPAVPYGSSGEHAAFAGTLSIGTDVLTQVIVELARSALGQTSPHSFQRVIFVNAHGGNHEALLRAAPTLKLEGRNVTMWWPTPEPPGPGEAAPQSDSHAGHSETSVMLAVAPELVQMERAEIGNTRPLGELLPRLRTGGLAAVTTNGVLGNPLTATAAHGRTLLQTWIAQLSAVL